MQKIRTIIKTPYEISDPEALWIDTSNAESPTLKVHEQGTWKSLGGAGGSDTYETKSNKVTNLSESSTDEQYPSAKAVYNAIEGAGGDSTVIIDAYRWESKRDDAWLSSGLTKEEALQVLGISEEELDRLLPTSTPNKDDNYCVIYGSGGYHFPNHRHYGAGAYSYSEDGTTVYYEGEASEVNYMVIRYNSYASELELFAQPRIVARLPISEGDPVLYDIYGCAVPPM